ncbi:MAG: MFS transporter [Bacteroidales bacterium]|nr:MFS transporter [Bacteroidales bacterium]
MDKKKLTFWQMFNLSFGFFGVQTAYALQNNSNSRIFASLGADPHDLSYFWILPPLMGLIVQPIIGSMSDKTWNRFGRRIPYLLFGAVIAVIVMALFPYAGSLGLQSVAAALALGAVCLMFLDTSLNIAMQPFKMMVGDMVTEEQKTKAYSIQSLLCNAGSLVGYLFPIVLAAIGISNTAGKGEVPMNVILSFWICAALLIACVIYTVAKVKEMPPKEYAEFHGIDLQAEAAKKEKSNFIKLLAKAPKTFWTVGLVQFFCWSAFLFMWNYSTGAVATNAWGVDTLSKGYAESLPYQTAGDWVGVLFAVQAVGSILWAMVLPRFKKISTGYIVSLVIGAIGFASVFFMHDKYLLCVSYFLIGTAWAAMLAYPFTLLTNALEGNPKMGSYLGLFNGTICLPQIIAALLGGSILHLVGSSQPAMFLVAGGLLVAGACCVPVITAKSKKN